MLVIATRKRTMEARMVRGTVTEARSQMKIQAVFRMKFKDKVMVKEGVAISGFRYTLRTRHRGKLEGFNPNTLLTFRLMSSRKWLQ